MTPEEMRTMIESAPYPLEGTPIYKRDWGDREMGGYGPAAESLARAMLIVADEDPSLLDVSAERERDSTGWDAANNEKLWEATQRKFPDLDKWLGGATGFQYGWAHNVVRYICGADAVGNPAIVTLGDDA